MNLKNLYRKLICLLVVLFWSLGGTESLCQGITREQKKLFVEETADACIYFESRKASNINYSQKAIELFCYCTADDLSKQITSEDIEFYRKYNRLPARILAFSDIIEKNCRKDYLK